MSEVSLTGSGNLVGLLGKQQQAMPHALALYQQQITMAHESSQEAKQQQPQPTKSQPYPGGRDSSSPRIRTRSPGISDREREGIPLCALLYLHPFLTYRDLSAVLKLLSFSLFILLCLLMSTASIERVVFERPAHVC